MSAETIEVMSALSENEGFVMSTAIIVPCRNEAGEIENLLNGILFHLKPDDELIVVEGGSYDPTWEIISNFATLHSDVKAIQQDGKGKFDAVLKGIYESTSEFVMIWDADGTVAFQDNLKIYDFTDSKCFLVTGDRLKGVREKGAMQFFNLIGNYFFATIWGILLRRGPLDSLCGSKKFPRSLMIKSPKWMIDRDPYGDFTMLGTALFLNIPVYSITVDYSARRYGKTNIHRWSGGLSLLKLILVIAFRRVKA